MASQSQGPARAAAQQFALYSAVDLATNPGGGNFEDFLFMRQEPGKSPEVSDKASGQGNAKKYQLSPAASAKPYSFAVVDLSNSAATLTRLKIKGVSGEWLFRDNASTMVLESTTSTTGTEITHPLDPGKKARLYSVIATQLIPGLQNGKNLHFNVLAEMTVNSASVTFGEDPEIEVDPGGDR